MQTFLLWRLSPDASGREDEVARVSARLRGYCRAMFGKVLKITTIVQGGHALAYMEMPVVGWKPPQFESNGKRWVLAIDYPVDADLAFSNDDVDRDESYLVRFASVLEARPESTLARVSPPFTLFHGAVGGNEIIVHNDSLGFCQTLEYANGATWALTNRPLALRALGLDLRPDVVEWAARAMSGWFPLERTGFKDLRNLTPATRLRLTERGATRTSYDSLRRMLSPLRLGLDETIETAGDSVRDQLIAASRFWSSASAGLSAGRDSRALIATMIGCGIPIDYIRTHGAPTNQEMILAQELASRTNLRHVLQTERGFPPPTSDVLERCLRTAARWQLGLMETKAQKIFCMKDPRLGAGKVNIMGKHGEIGRGYYYRRARKSPGGIADWRGSLTHYLTVTDRDLLLPEPREAAIELIRTSVVRAADFGMDGHSALDFFYLYERTRKWAPGTIYNQPSKVVTPFLNPRYIQAVFSLPPATKEDSVIQDFMVRKHFKEWTTIPYLTDRDAAKWCRRRLGRARRIVADVADFVRSLADRQTIAYRSTVGKRYAFSNDAYWRVVGKGLIDSALVSSELVNSVFDREKLAKRWPREPDLLAVAATVEAVGREAIESVDPVESGGPAIQ